MCFDLYSIISGNPVLAIQRHSTCSLFVQEYCIIYNSTTNVRVDTVYLPLKPKGFPLCLVAFWSFWRDCCLIFSSSFFRFLSVMPLFGAKTGRCTPFWRSPLNKLADSNKRRVHLVYGRLFPMIPESKI